MSNGVKKVKNDNKFLSNVECYDKNNLIMSSLFNITNNTEIISKYYSINN